jgi:hypothetical protein
VDAYVDMHPARALTSSASRRAPDRPVLRARRARPSRSCDHGTPGTGSRSIRNSSG